MKAKKRLGQNFLKDETVIMKIANEIEATPEDLIIEIGPGRGALTKKLLTKNCKVLAYELDLDLKPVLINLNKEQLTVIFKDILKSNIKEDIKDIKYKELYLVGNLPYYITTPIIEHIISQDLDFKKFTIMVQKEVADRFLAKPKSKNYGYMTLLLNYYFELEKVCDVSKYAFVPVPKVESAVVSFRPRENKPEVDISKYKVFLKNVFRQKRKTLKNNIGGIYDWDKLKKVLAQRNILEQVRAEELSEDVLIDLFHATL